MALLILLLTLMASWMNQPAEEPPQISFCGPELDYPGLLASFEVGSKGITAMHGPCRPAPEEYTATEPGSRYAAWEEYRTLAWFSCAYGWAGFPKIVVYDPLVWEDPAAGLERWAPYLHCIEGFDLGDEPTSAQLDTVIDRAWAVHSVGLPYKINLFGPSVDLVGSERVPEGWQAYISRWDSEAPPGAISWTSYDLFETTNSVEWVRSFSDREVHCTVSSMALYHEGVNEIVFERQSVDDIDVVQDLCDGLLVFSAILPESHPAGYWCGGWVEGEEC